MPFLRDFEIPDSVVSAYWNKIIMYSSHERKEWTDPKNRGVVMEFMNLRQFLAEETEKYGGKLRLGYVYKRHSQTADGVEAEFKCQQTGTVETLRTRVLVDATGSERQVLAKSLHVKGNSFPSTGIEYLVEVPNEIYKKYAQALSVFMGHKWMPQGYSWIFPMEPNKLKVGVGRYFQNEQVVPHESSYTHYLDIMMQQCLGSTKFPVLDKHGKTLIYTYGRADPHYDNNVVAIGDAVSSINPLAYEGIRHAMVNARIAAKHIAEKLDGRKDAFDAYAKEFRKYIGYKWTLCEKLMRIIYREPRDNRIDNMVKAFQTFSMDDMIDLAFDYKLSKAIKFLFRYAAKSLRFRTQ